jgi:hypothetical protein
MLVVEKRKTVNFYFYLIIHKPVIRKKQNSYYKIFLKVTSLPAKSVIR